jgi:hypothetical protein
MILLMAGLVVVGVKVLLAPGHANPAHAPMRWIQGEIAVE